MFQSYHAAVVDKNSMVNIFEYMYKRLTLKEKFSSENKIDD